MITVMFVEETYLPPVDDEDYCPDGPDDVRSWTDWLTFRELVEMMQREFVYPSSSPASGSVYDWVSTEHEQDPYNGETSVRSMHYSSEHNHKRNEKYWRLAMKAAGMTTPNNVRQAA